MADDDLSLQNQIDAQRNLLTLLQTQTLMMQNAARGLYAAPQVPTSIAMPLNVGTFPGPSGLQFGQTPPWLGSLGDMMSTLMMFMSGPTTDYLHMRGFMPGQMFGRYSPYEQVQNAQMFSQLQTTMQSAMPLDVNTLANIVARASVVARDTTPSAEEMRQITDVSHGVAEKMVGFGSTVLPALLASPQGLRAITDDSMIGSVFGRLFGSQAFAAYLGSVGRNVVTPQGVGLQPEVVADFTRSMSRYYAPEGIEDVARTRGFTLAQVGGMYSELLRRGAVDRPPDISEARQIPGAIGGAGMQMHEARLRASQQQLDGILQVAEMAAEMLGPGAPLEKIIQAMEEIAGSPLRNIGGGRAADIIRNLREVARTSGIPVRGLMELGAMATSLGAPLGMTGNVGQPIALQAANLEQLYRNRVPVAGAPTGSLMSQSEALQSLTKNLVGGVESTVGVTAGNLARFRRDLGRLPRSLEQALQDLQSGELPRVESARQVLQNPLAVAQAMRQEFGGAEFAYLSGLRNREAAQPFIEQFGPDILRAQITAIPTQERETFAAAIRATGLNIQNPEVYGRDLFFEFVKSGRVDLGREKVAENIAMRVYNKPLQDLTTAEKERVSAAALSITEVFRPAIKGHLGDERNAFLVSTKKEEQTLRRDQAVGAAMREAYRELMPEAGRTDFFGRIMHTLSSLTPESATFDTMVGTLLGQQPISRFFGPETADADLDREMAARGVTTFDANQKRKTRARIAFELGEKLTKQLETAVESGNEKEADRIREEMSQFFSGNAGGLFIEAVSLQNIKKKIEEQGITDPTELADFTREAVRKHRDAMRVTVGDPFRIAEEAAAQDAARTALSAPFTEFQAAYNEATKPTVKSVQQIRGMLSRLDTTLFDEYGLKPEFQAILPKGDDGRPSEEVVKKITQAREQAKAAEAEIAESLKSGKPLTAERFAELRDMPLRLFEAVGVETLYNMQPGTLRSDLKQAAKDVERASKPPMLAEPEAKPPTQPTPVAATPAAPRAPLPYEKDEARWKSLSPAQKTEELTQWLKTPAALQEWTKLSLQQKTEMLSKIVSETPDLKPQETSAEDWAKFPQKHKTASLMQWLNVEAANALSQPPEDLRPPYEREPSRWTQLSPEQKVEELTQWIGKTSERAAAGVTIPDSSTAQQMLDELRKITAALSETVPEKPTTAERLAKLPRADRERIASDELPEEEVERIFETLVDESPPSLIDIETGEMREPSEEMKQAWPELSKRDRAIAWKEHFVQLDKIMSRMEKSKEAAESVAHPLPPISDATVTDLTAMKDVASSVIAPQVGAGTPVPTSQPARARDGESKDAVDAVLTGKQTLKVYVTNFEEVTGPANIAAAGRGD